MQKKVLEILSFYTCVPLIEIIWCMIPEIWSSTDRIFCHCGQFLSLLPPLLSSKAAWKIKIWKKWKKKTPGDSIILHNCTKNHGHMLYCCWDLVRDGCNCYFSFSAMLFLLPTPPTLTTPKLKNSKPWKKGLGISFYTRVPKTMIICYTVPGISHVLDVIVFFTLGNF